MEVEVEGKGSRKKRNGFIWDNCPKLVDPPTHTLKREILRDLGHLPEIFDKRGVKYAIITLIYTGCPKKWCIAISNSPVVLYVQIF